MEASINFSFPRGERPISELLAGIPRSFREQAKKGFNVIAGITPQDYATVLVAVVRSLENRTPSPLDDLERRLSLPKSDLSALFAASMLTVSILSESGTSDEFLTASSTAD